MSSRKSVLGRLTIGVLAVAVSACAGAHQSGPLPQPVTQGAASFARRAVSAQTTGMCPVYAGYGTLSFCYDLDEASGTTLVDSSAAGNNGTITSSGVTYHAPGLTSNSTYAETTNGSTGAMTSGFDPATGSFSVSFFVSLVSNPDTYPRLAGTGNPAHASPANGWNIAVDNNSSNSIYVNMGYGTGNTAFGYIPLALSTPSNVTLTYNASSKVATLCVGSGSSPACKSTTLPAAYAASENPVVLGGVGITPSNATFDEAAFWQGTVLTSAQISTIASYTGNGLPEPSPTPSPTASSAGMCSVYSGSGALSFCYNFDEAAGTTLVDSSGAGKNGTITSTGVTYHASGLTSNSSYAQTTNGSAGSMTSGFDPAAGSFSLSFFVSLRSNPDTYVRLASTGNSAHTSPAAGWNLAVDNTSSNDIYANIGYGSGNAVFGYLPLALNTPANVTLTYNATSNVVTLCVGSGSAPACKSTTLAAAYVASGNPIVFGGAGIGPSNATFDEAAYWQGTVLTSAQISSIASYAGAGAPTPMPSTTPSATPSSSPSAVPSGTFTDWPMYQNDAQHDGYVNDAAITPQTIGSLHLVWEHTALEGITSHGQPVVATNIAGHSAVVYLGGSTTGDVWAFDGLTGDELWTASLGYGTPPSGSQSGVRGTGAIDRNHSVVYYPDGIHRIHALALDGLTDAWTPVDVAPTSPPDNNALHNLVSVGMTLAPTGTLYAATGSASDNSPWIGRVVAINTNTAAITNTFYTAYDPAAGTPYSGGGIWDWGGATLDPAGDVYVTSGNADLYPASPFIDAPDQEVAYAEHITQLSAGLSVLNSALPAAAYSSTEDMDFSGTPVVFQPVGCADKLLAATGKSGLLTILDTTALSGTPLMTLTIAPPSSGADNETNPSFSASTGLLYEPITDSATAYAGGEPGMIAIGFSGCTPSVVWNSGTAFGVSAFTTGRQWSAPTVTSGGVVLEMAPSTSSGTGGLYALDASSGALLNGGNPLFTTNGPGRMGPIVDGDWIWISDSSGDLYGLTTGSSAPALRGASSAHRTIPIERDRN